MPKSNSNNEARQSANDDRRPEVHQVSRRQPNRPLPRQTFLLPRPQVMLPPLIQRIHSSPSALSSPWLASSSHAHPTFSDQLLASSPWSWDLALHDARYTATSGLERLPTFAYQNLTNSALVRSCRTPSYNFLPDGFSVLFNLALFQILASREVRYNPRSHCVSVGTNWRTIPSLQLLHAAGIPVREPAKTIIPAYIPACMVLRIPFASEVQPMYPVSRECEVCFEEFDNGPHRALSLQPACGHVFGESCLISWFNSVTRAPKCPKCSVGLAALADWSDQHSLLLLSSRREH
ncbi:hypothetical protein DM02DRAFT_725422 [Periconia macrospinosa]|uniref:RING-type domain-containing protein n=1 Tax=Periconia macrospinosa TaxID=97972 RepID=A0A2V1E6Q3_9PLEO|nr:hypothetical protein DM02DRAFT_725422 [Periconia macrospinosa]